MCVPSQAVTTQVLRDSSQLAVIAQDHISAMRFVDGELQVLRGGRWGTLLRGTFLLPHVGDELVAAIAAIDGVVYN